MEEVSGHPKMRRGRKEEKMMSHDERTTVHMASKAESRAHQYWPKAAVEKFLAAEVIGARQTKRETIALKADGKFLQLVAHFFPVNVFRRPVRGM